MSLCVWLQNDVSQWHIVFYIASAVYFAGNLFFVLFGKGEIQPWNDPDAPRKWMQPTMYIIIPVRMQAIFVLHSSNI
jgi:dipeptide/tripeptide permease